MIPELGRHAGPVLGAYGVTLLLLGLLVLTSCLRAARLRAEVERTELEIEGARDGQA